MVLLSILFELIIMFNASCSKLFLKINFAFDILVNCASTDVAFGFSLSNLLANDKLSVQFLNS